MKKALLILLIVFPIIISAMSSGGGNGNDPCSNPMPPPWCPVIPIDTHLEVLLIIGALFSGYKIYSIYNTVEKVN